MKILTTLSVLMFAFISIITTLRLRNYLRYRSKKKIARNKYTRMIEDTNHCQDGWRMSWYAYLLKNSCPECGQPLYAAYQSSPAETWKRLCGRAGILVYCTHCQADLNFFLAIMN